MREDLSTARHEDSLNQQLNVLVGPQYHPSDYASECESLIALKWRVALPVASLGGLVIATVLAADVVSVRGPPGGTGPRPRWSPPPLASERAHGAAPTREMRRGRRRVATS